MSLPRPIERLRLRSLDGPFGAEVAGVDLGAAVDLETRAALDRALVERQLLVVPGQDLDEVRLAEVAAWFGPVRPVPGGDREGVPGVRKLSNLGADGRPTGTHPDPFSREWHADGAWMKIPGRATVLYALQVPEEGGCTQFADMIGGLAAFDQPERERLERLEVIHDVELSRVLRFGRSVYPGPEPRRPVRRLRRRLRGWSSLLRRAFSSQVTVHPVVRIHPESGRPAMVLGCDAWRIRQMGWRRGMREVEALTERSVRPELVHTHRWQAGDLVIWDNRSLLHRVTAYDHIRETRVMRQVVLEERAESG